MRTNHDQIETRFASVIAGLPPSTPFVPPETLERQSGKKLRLRLGANESAFGPSAEAVEAMRRAAAETHLYGDPESYELRTALAGLHTVRIENIVVGNGIDGLLGYCARAFVDPSSAVVTSLGSYPTFNYHVLACGGSLRRVAYQNDYADLQSLADIARESGARLVYLANPDSPSGTWHTALDVRFFLERLPSTSTLVLDEAYAEFAPSDAIPPIDPDKRNIIRLRTFSKAHGLAGARIGYAIAHPSVIDVFNRFRNQFEVSRISQAGALASLGDDKHVAKVVRSVEQGRGEYARLAAEMGIETVDSATNFVCIDVGSVERARAMLAALLQHGVFIRMPGEAPLNRCIRVTVGTQEQRAEFERIFRTVWKEVQECA